MSREIDVRVTRRPRATAQSESDIRALEAEVSAALPGEHSVQALATDQTTGNAVRVVSQHAQPQKGNYVQRAVEHVQRIRQMIGLRESQPAEFLADPNIQTTSSGAVTVHLQQQYKGLPIFQASESVRFGVDGALAETAGNAVTVADDKAMAANLSPRDAVIKAAVHVAQPSQDEFSSTDQFGEPLSIEAVDLAHFEPKIVASYPNTLQQSALFEPGPFGDKIKAGLIWFDTGQDLRLAWEVLITMPETAGQYRTLVDAESGDLLYCHQMMCAAAAQGNVYGIDGGGGRQIKLMPLPLSTYDLPIPQDLPTGYADDWVSDTSTAGNATVAHLGATGPVLSGDSSTEVVSFNPADQAGDDQKVLNIFYYNGYMHDFFYLLGFREADGNFQSDNLGRGGFASDPVDARAHSGPVWGTANMGTPADGWSPVMNMGLVSSTNRHTAFDSTVVFHEFTHGVTNRLVGGPLNDQALESPQSGGMGEGWGDYIACSINDTTVVGDWVVKNAGGIRGFPYDTSFPDGFGSLGTGRYVGVHAIGEIWCATLMEVNRQIGKPLALQLVVDALKLSPANPSFLDMRDAILIALDDKHASNTLSEAEHTAARFGIWTAFAHYGMGPQAQSNGASLSGIVADNSMPDDIGEDTDSDQESSVIVESAPDVGIPDPEPGRRTDVIAVQETGTIQSVAINVDIEHSFVGDLRLIVTSPEGTSVTLLEPTGIAQEDLMESYTLDNTPSLAEFVGQSGEGNWTLSVEDTQPEDVGRLRSWNVQIDFESDATLVRGEAEQGVVESTGFLAASNPITFACKAKSTRIKVGLDLKHAHGGDLKVSLVAPSGKRALIHNRRPFGADKLAAVYDSKDVPVLAAMVGEPILGEWYLQISDRACRDQCKLNRWHLEIGVADESPDTGFAGVDGLDASAQFTDAEMVDGFSRLGQLAQSEYGISLREMLADSDTELAELRLARLIGVLLKGRFAARRDVNYSRTHAAYSWQWQTGSDWENSLNDPANEKYAALLTDIKETCWAERYGDAQIDPWDWFQSEVDSERGLFKVLALWLHRKIEGESTGSFDELLNADENPEFELALNSADMCSQFALGMALAPIIPIPGIAIGIGMMVSKYGYRKIRDWATNDSVSLPDQSS